MITVYGVPQTRSARVTWLLEELGVDYTFHKLDFSKGEHRSPEYLAINPGGKVPVIDIDGVVMTESGAITTYLADCYPDRGLIPAAGSPQRATYERWSYFALCELEQPLWNISKHTFALPKEKRVPELIPTAQWEFQIALQLLSDGLGDKPFILGDEFQAVDVLLGHTLFWATAVKQPLKHANVKDYVRRLQGREALRRAREKEDAA